MEKYLGVKMIGAKPMNRLEYNRYRGWDLPNNEDGSDKGMLVEYEGSTSNHIDHDGYISWSPIETFEEAYRRTEGLTYGLAIEAMKLGKCVARKGWNGSGMFVFYQIPSEIPKEVVPKMSSVPDSVKSLMDLREQGLSYKNGMIIVKPDGSADSWVASSSDTFEEDWFILN